MIVNFSIQNFGSIKDRQTLSFEANRSTHLSSAYVVEAGGLRLLKLALIYGANASGKTMVLKALDFLRMLVLEPENKKTGELDFHPFLFDAHTPNAPATLVLELLQNGVKYAYEVVFLKNAIVSERLDYYNPKRANVFHRITRLEDQLAQISFGSKIKIDRASEAALISNTLWNNTVLGGFLKTNVEVTELKEVTDWFRYFLKPLVSPRTTLAKYITTLINNNMISKKEVINILQKADLNISNISRTPAYGLALDELAKVSKLAVVVEEEEYSSPKLVFEHTVGGKTYELPFELESQGTQRYYGFAGLLALLVKNAVILPVDELETSLHPDLFSHFLLSFLLNAEQSQLICTTHNREILNNKDLFRDDAIWITHKDDASSTVLYSLSDFGTDVIRDTTNRLNAFKSGRLGGIPNLLDPFIAFK